MKNIASAFRVSIFTLNPFAMKKLYIVLVTLLCLVFSVKAQNNVGINDDNSNPKASAMLDVFSATKGLLIPRVALTLSTTAAPVTTPETSLLIFNTATVADVTPGYYYWDGSSKWVRLATSTDPSKFSSVTKTANATLLKTENMVFASGDITLTLPTVTSADDGLEIVIKNVGTVTDLITIVPQSGKMMDNNTSTTLTRWRGRSYIANGSNWNVKIKEVRTDNLLDLSVSGSFTTIAEVVSFLNAHMDGPTVVRMGGQTDSVTSTQIINLPYPVTFEGLSSGETTIPCPSNGSTAFDVRSECYFKMLKFVGGATPGIGINFSGTNKYHEIKASSFKGFSKAVVISGSIELWLFETNFTDCITSGVEIAAGTANVNFKNSHSDFTNCAKGISLVSFGTGSKINLNASVFYNSTGQTGIVYVPPVTSPYYSSIIIQGNSFNNVGTFVSGMDFTNARDANIFFQNNVGVEDENPHCKISVNDYTTFTTVTTAGTYYKAGWVNTSSYTSKWTVANNRITYLSNNRRDGWAVISGNISVDDNNLQVSIAIVKNGVVATLYGKTKLRIVTANQPFQFSTVIYIPDIIKNDYLELYFTSSQNGDHVTFNDIQWFTNTQ